MADTNQNESRLEKMYKSANLINGEQKPTVVANLGKDDFENSGQGGVFVGNYTNNALNYSDSFEKSMKHGINKNWWSEIVSKTK